MTVHRDFWNILLEIGIALLGVAPVAVGLVVRLVFFSQNLFLSRVLSLENVGLLFGMVFLALAVFWVLDTHNEIFWALLVLPLISIVILTPCAYTGEVSLASFGVPISISLVSIAVLVFYIGLFLLLHLVWEEWCLEYVTASVLLFAAIFTENVILSLFAFSFSLVIVMMIRGYGKMGYLSSNVVIYRLGKPVRKRRGTFLIIPFIEEFRPEFEEHVLKKP